MPLNPESVPKEVHTLLPLAERWHIGDDFEREAAVAGASVLDLQTLVAALESPEADFLYEWLAGPESHSLKPTSEYLALTHLTMAADSARLKLKRRDEKA